MCDESRNVASLHKFEVEIKVLFVHCVAQNR
jgi:hypothetical protein